MKRILIIISILCFLLCGCQLFSRESREPVLFYYQTAEFVLGESNGSIDSEERDGTGHITDWDYLIRLYLAGPLSEELVSPFPEDVALTNIRTGKNIVTITLSGSPDTLSETELILACACLTLTSLEITHKDSIMICWGEEIITMDRDCMTLFDESVLLSE